MMIFLKTRSLRQLCGLAMISAAAMAFCYQATKNAVTASKFSEGWMSYIDAAGGVAVELFVAAAAIGIIVIAREGKLKTKKALAGLMLLCVTFGVIAASQQVAVGRGERTAQIDINRSNLTDRSIALADARKALADPKMAKVPSVLAAQSEIDKLKTRKGWAESKGCADPGSYTTLCRQVAAATAVLGQAEAKARYERIAETSLARNETVKGSQTANPDPLADVLASFYGLTVGQAQIGLAFFSAFTMMALAMFGTHFGLVVYGLDDEHIVAARPTERPEVVPFVAPRASSGPTRLQYSAMTGPAKEAAA